jgi:hypothetical protein
MLRPASEASMSFGLEKVENLRYKHMWEYRRKNDSQRKAKSKAHASVTVITPSTDLL